MKKFAALSLALLLALSLAACSKTVTGEAGKTYSTQWFDFSADTFAISTEYGGYSPASGYVFLVVHVTEKNTWRGKEALPMSDADFYLTLNGDPDDWLYCEDPWAEAQMPNSFSLGVGETVDYDLVFHIPEDTETVQFIYVEVNEKNETGKTYTVEHTL